MKTKTEEEIHYRSLIKFIIWALGISGTLLTSMFVVGSFVTYQSLNDAKAELTQNLKDAKERIKDVDDRAKIALEETKSDAAKAINNTKNEAVITAINTSKEKVEQTFKENNIQSLIEIVAKNEIEGRVQTMIDHQLAQLVDVQNQMPIFMLALDKIRWGEIDGLYTLDSMYVNAKDSTSKNIAHILLIEKGIQYKADLRLSDATLDKLYSNAVKDTLQIGKKKLISNFKNDILKKHASGRMDIYDVTLKTIFLSKLLGVKLDVFDLEAIRNIPNK